MPEFPPQVDITGPDKFHEWVNAYQKGLWAACLNIDNTAIVLHADIIETLKAEGLDQTGRFNSSSASKAAATVSKKLKRASDNLNAAIILIKGAKLAAEQNVDAPIAAARAERARSKKSRYTV
jgi:hypothetical protein